MKRTALFRLFGVLVLIASLAGGWFWIGLRTFAEAPVGNEETVILEVPPGITPPRLAAHLAAEGVIDHPGYFLWLLRLRGADRRLQAGEYEIPPGITVEELVQNLVHGRVRLHSLTVVEGWTFDRLRAALAAHPAIRHTLADVPRAEVMARLGKPGMDPEGWFLPDTYLFPRGTSDREFLARALQAMERVLAEEWAGRDPDLPLQSPYEALILASIVEKETAVPEERARIAGVFIRRLQRGMRLQTDPTVIYGLGEAFDGNLRKRHLQDRANPYNTYRHAGLPPTPIALPGRAAIHAVLHPAPGDDLYFVAKGDGSHHFSATVEEHNRAVRRYQLRRKSDYRSRPAP